MTPLSSSAEGCLDQLATRIPDAMALFRSDRASWTLAAYAEALRRLPSGQSSRLPVLQDGEDLAALAAEETARLLGPPAARALTRTLEDHFCALTANHHGADFHPEFVQGSLLFALPLLTGGQDGAGQRAVPIFACGGVPRHNVAYPRGILLGRGEGTCPRRFPVLPDKNRRILVSVQPPFSAADVQRALVSLTALNTRPGKGRQNARPLFHAERQALATVLNRVFAAPRVLAQTCYRDQATVMNSLLWPLMFAPEVRPPLMVSLDMQFLIGRLASADLAKHGSLLHVLALEPQAALALWNSLNGVRGCWTGAPETRQENTGGQAKLPLRGTFLFWAIDEQGRPVAMGLDAAGRHLLAVGRPDMDLPLAAQDLAAALAARRIMPGLYLYFALAALARGLLCGGGVYQTGYLTAMRKGTADALRACGENALADRVEAAPDSPLVTGFLPLRVPAAPAEDARENESMACPEGWSCAAGPVDMLARGGLNAALLDRLGAMTVRDAFTAALPYHYEDLIPETERLPGWRQRLCRPSGLMLPLLPEEQVLLNAPG